MNVKLNCENKICGVVFYLFLAIVSLSHEYKMERLLCFSLKCAKIELENELQLKAGIDCVHPFVLKKKDRNRGREAAWVVCFAERDGGKVLSCDVLFDSFQLFCLSCKSLLIISTHLCQNMSLHI